MEFMVDLVNGRVIAVGIDKSDGERRQRIGCPRVTFLRTTWHAFDLSVVDSENDNKISLDHTKY